MENACEAAFRARLSWINTARMTIGKPRMNRRTNVPNEEMMNSITRKA